MFQLTLKHVLERASKYFPRKEIVSITGQRKKIRLSYSSMHERVRKLADQLAREFEVGQGDRVGVLCWNVHENLELHFAVPCLGAALHTANLRFSDEQLVETINQAGDKVLFFDPELTATVFRIAGKLTTVDHLVTTGSEQDVKGRDALSYERFIARGDPLFTLPEVREDSAAAICFTTGTTGNPKGAVYNHRGIFLNALVKCMPDTLALSERDTILQVVPLYHISGWFMPYAATLVGAKQVLPGPRPTVEAIYSLVRDEAVTISNGVPTVWQGFLEHIRQREKRDKIASLKRLVIGGSAPPESLLQGFERLGIHVIHGWGMTETYDAAAFSYLKSYMPTKQLARIRIVKKQGLPPPCVEASAITEDGRQIAWDGKEKGELIVRGAFVIENYLGQSGDDEQSFVNGWLRTGDIVTIDKEGYIEIEDRKKDLIRSGGEWISSIALENKIMSHPSVLEACVISVSDQKWGERPLAVVVPREGRRLSKKEILSALEKDFPRWWLPVDLVFTHELPKTSVGKLDKKALRMQYANYPTKG